MADIYNQVNKNKHTKTIDALRKIYNVTSDLLKLSKTNDKDPKKTPKKKEPL